ncbi:MAG: alanine--tRNA ligase [Deltaproteobacteria bacterium]|jgi:alanyl-tRNA synthetase|nr:alanine--tRNA ligase [Deltaproteobacteria bacterium]
MNSSALRQSFLDYFQKLDHRRVGSGSLVPRDDPTLLFTNAGMVQFKRLFTGEEKRDYARATTSQKCVRAGGKHNDLENVGYTARHHTFFEMLGNFSFGDYFKSEAIVWAWDLLTRIFNLPADKLYVTVFREDDEAADLWAKLVGIPADRLVRLDEKDNFWAMGDTGPCGPCSEILIDQGPELGCGRPDCAPGCDCDRYLEIWNLVFMQFERTTDGETRPLPRPSIDTGMGLERLAAVTQKVPSNFETDLFRPLLEKVASLSGIPYVYGKILTQDDKNFQTNVSLRVIADHSRAVTFLISDGVRPENLGRGYVLRRILRRAVRHGRKLGLDRPFLTEVVSTVIDTLKGPYPEISDQASYIKSLILSEEERFGETLGTGLAILNQAIEDLKAKNQQALDGFVAFKLYDTYGFPIDLVSDVAREHGLSVDEAGFEESMSNQRAKGRAAWRSDRGAGDAALTLINSLTATGFTSGFTGYDHFTEIDKVPALIIKNGQSALEAQAGDEVSLIFTKTPFYAASGGQTGDLGRIIFSRGKVEVLDTFKVPGGVIVHRGRVTEGVISLTPATLAVDMPNRLAVMANHSATHLLHNALRTVLGDHVRQAGSQVSAEKLRFDFTHQSQVREFELTETERLVNREISLNWPVETQVLDYEEAVRTGAMALFEERYGDKVRVVTMGPSRELCGGTHAQRTGDIGFFLILSESAVAAGVRRLECLTGVPAIAEFQKIRGYVKDLAGKLKSKPEELSARLQKLLDQAKTPKPEPTGFEPGPLAEQAETVGGIKFLAREVTADEPRRLRELGDLLREKLGPESILALAARSRDNKALLLVSVSKELADKFPAGLLIGPMAEAVGGRGGGNPLLAQAGGPNADGLAEALLKVKTAFLEALESR